MQEPLTKEDERTIYDRIKTSPSSAADYIKEFSYIQVNDFLSLFSPSDVSAEITDRAGIRNYFEFLIRVAEVIPQPFDLAGTISFSNSWRDRLRGFYFFGLDALTKDKDRSFSKEDLLVLLKETDNCIMLLAYEVYMYACRQRTEDARKDFIPLVKTFLDRVLLFLRDEKTPYDKWIDVFRSLHLTLLSENSCFFESEDTRNIMRERFVELLLGQLKAKNDITPLSVFGETGYAVRIRPNAYNRFAVNPRFTRNVLSKDNIAQITLITSAQDFGDPLQQQIKEAFEFVNTKEQAGENWDVDLQAEFFTPKTT